MSNNLSYSIIELNSIKESNSETDLSWMLELTNDTIDNQDSVLSHEIVLELEFNEYNLKELVKFCDYYKIPRNRMKKQDIIKQLILFETNEKNKEIVEMRRTLWEYFLTLYHDPYFKKFIICDL